MNVLLRDLMTERKETEARVAKYADILSRETETKPHYRELNILLNLLKDELETLDNLIAIETGGWNVRPTY